MKSSMRRRFAFWLTLRPALVLAAMAAIASYLLIELWLRKIPECFPGASAVGDMVVGVSMSVIAAFIFYLIDIHVKEYSARNRVHRYIAPLVKKIMLEGLGFVHSLDSRRVLNNQMCSHYTVTDLVRLLKWYDRTDENARYMVALNYQERMASITSLIDEILVHYAGLDPELIDIIQGMKRSYLFFRIDSFNLAEKLTGMANPLLEFLYRLRDLNGYMTKHIPDYFEEESHPDFAMYERYQQFRSELRARRRTTGVKA